MHRNAGCFADRVQSRNDHFGVIADLRHNLPMIITRNTAHIIVDRRRHWQRLSRQVNACENLSAFRNTGQALRQYCGIDMVKMQIDMVLVRTDATAFAHF